MMSPPSRWRALDGALAHVFINKTTGNFVSPDEAISGDWKTLQAFLEVYARNRTLTRGDTPEPYPELTSLDLSTPPEAAKMWEKCMPVESVPAKEFKELLKLLKLPVRELKPEDFARFEARVTSEMDQLVFPVRYSSKSNPLIGLRLVRLCPDSGQLLEENLPCSFKEGETTFTSRVFPFPHGLDLAARGNAVMNIVLVASVLDSVAIAASTAASSWAPVALAEGCAFLPPDHLPYLESQQRLAIWFPTDPAAVDATRVFSRKLDERRCLLMGRDVGSPVLALRKVRSAGVSEALKNRLRPCAHEFITTFEALREDVFLEMAHYEEVEGASRSSRCDTCSP